MSRRFYTDPLAAAWMAKHFGMRFQAWYGTIPGYRSIEVLPLIDSERHYQRHIHPDSLPLLEPKLDDAIQIGDDLLFWVCGDDSWWEEHKDDPNLKYNFIGIKSASCFMDEGARIIQRDGKPFHWPESEEV